MIKYLGNRFTTFLAVGMVVQLMVCGLAQSAGPSRQLSMEEAVGLAFENNLNLRVERMNPELQDLAVRLAKTAWTPNLTAAINKNNLTSPVSNFFAGATDKLIRNVISANVGANQLLSWGANYQVTWDTQRLKSNSIYDSQNPLLGATLNFTFSQPLLRNRKTDAARHQLLVSKKNRELSDIELRRTVLTTVRNVKYAYWNLKASTAAVQVAQQSLDLAKQLLSDNRSNVEIGMMAAIDIVEAEAEVARRNEAVISTEAKRKRVEDELRTLILDTKDPDYWNVRFDLTEHPVTEARKVDMEEAVKTAIEKRTDLQQIRKKLEISTATIHYRRNQILPDLKAQVGYGMIGQGGMKLLYGPGFPPPVAGKVHEGYGTAIARMLGNEYRNWSIAVQFSYPIGDSAAEADLARAKLLAAQLEGQLKNLELQVITSVREVARNVETYQLSLVSSQATRKLMERRLDAEQKKYSAGLSTNFLVLQAQRDLAEARHSELLALLNYNKSLVDIETVLEAPTAGPGVIVTTVTGP